MATRTLLTSLSDSPEMQSSGTIAALNDLPDLPRGVWLRGQPSDAWGLLPTLLRATRTKEQPRATRESGEIEMNREFLRLAATLIPPGISLTEVYIRAQHHGFATRLLDWTTNPLAALYFAVTKNYDRAGSLFVLDPTYRVEGSPNERAVNGPVSESHRGLELDIERLFGEPDKALLRGTPIPFAPSLRFERMLLQDSRFTYFPRNPLSFPEDRVWRYEIPRNAKTNIERQLARFGINRFTLYRDLQALGEHLHREWRRRG